MSDTKFRITISPSSGSVWKWLWKLERYQENPSPARWVVVERGASLSEARAERSAMKKWDALKEDLDFGSDCSHTIDLG